MPVWAVANQKGGVGKTTTAVSLAGLLAQRGHRTLLVDLDPHGSASVYFGWDPDRLEHGVYALFQSPPADPRALVRPTRFPGLSVLPAQSAMATLDRQLGTRDGMGLVLARALATLRGSFDYAVLDSPPQLGVLMVNALAASDRLLIPVQTEFLALQGLERMLRTLEMIGRARRDPPPHLIVPTLFDRRTRASIECLAMLRARYPDTLWSGAIPIDTLFRDAAQAGVPLGWMRASSRGATAYAALLDNLTAPRGERPQGVSETEVS